MMLSFDSSVMHCMQQFSHLSISDSRKIREKCEEESEEEFDVQDTELVDNYSEGSIITLGEKNFEDTPFARFSDEVNCIIGDYLTPREKGGVASLFLQWLSGDHSRSKLITPDLWRFIRVNSRDKEMLVNEKLDVDGFLLQQISGYYTNLKTLVVSAAILTKEDLKVLNKPFVFNDLSSLSLINCKNLEPDAVFYFSGILNLKHLYLNNAIRFFCKSNGKLMIKKRACNIILSVFRSLDGFYMLTLNNIIIVRDEYAEWVKENYRLTDEPFFKFPGIQFFYINSFR